MDVTCTLPAVDTEANFGLDVCSQPLAAKLATKQKAAAVSTTDMSNERGAGECAEGDTDQTN